MPLNPLQERTLTAFKQQFGRSATLSVRAPGRVNLIGEHTDYNDGFVLPMAIDRALWIALRPREDRQLILHSLDFEETAVVDLDNLQKGSGWIEYVKGMAWALQEAGYPCCGWEGVLTSDVPLGAGLSSSAALEVGAARAFMAVANHSWDAPTMAQLAQQAENEWVGLNCGLMDQMISAAGQAGQAMLLDCRSLGMRFVPLPEATAVVVLDTRTRRGLVDSAYNQRRQQCQQAADFFGVSALRDISLTQFEQGGGSLDPLIRHRARHVISENERTEQAARAMEQGDAMTLGQLMSASHISLRDDFSVSREEVDIMVTCAQQEAGCYGARMTGAGFGGCAVALVEREKVAGWTTAVATAYTTQTHLTPHIYICTATNGATCYPVE